MKRCALLILLSLIILGSLSYFGVNRILWIKEQEAINMTSAQVAEIIKNAGFEITNYRILSLEEAPLAFEEGDICFDIELDGMLYLVCIAERSGWKSAKTVSKELNALDNRMQGGFVHCFYYGPILVAVGPRGEEVIEDYYKELAIELYEVIANADN